MAAGSIPAGKYHRLACERHIRDRAAEGTDDFPYRFDGRRAARFIKFAELLRHYKGEWAGKPIQLTPIQRFRLGAIFGWIHSGTGLRRFRTAYNELPRKQGKALALDTPVPTPSGWTRHGDLQVGDLVFGPDGKPKRVEWVSPAHSGPCYRLTLSTGESLVAHARHEWVTRRTWFTGRPKGSRRPLPPIETGRLSETLRGGARGDFVHRIDVAAPLDLPDVALPVPPYTMGVWLGDGSSGSGTVTIAEQDLDIVARVRAEGVPCRQRTVQDGDRLFALTTGDRSQRARNRSVESSLRRFGVLGDKHIPTCYLRASYRQRLELLRGLVDTDGHLGAKGVYEVVSCHERLALDIRELIHTLGLKTTLQVDRARLNGRDCGPRWRILFSAHLDQVAHLARKQTAWRPARARRSRGRTVVAVEPCPSVPVNCIQVEGGLYLVGRDFVTTHNSLEAACVALYVSFFDGEPGAEGYCIATKREQAKIVFADAKELVKSSGLKERIGVFVGNLHNEKTRSKLEPLGADSDSTDGLNPNLIITDELHAHKTRGLIDVMESATGARRQPLHFQITTAGNDPVSPCGDQHDYATKVLERVIEDETFFAIICHADPEDDWLLEETWIKANPHWGISVKPDDMRALAQKARNMPAAAPEFKQKRLNLWVNAVAPWLSIERWRAGQTIWAAEDMRGQPCWIGVDLSSKIDLTAVVFAFPPADDRRSWRLWVRTFTPEDTLDDRAHRDRAPYRLWTHAGVLETIRGNRIDQAAVVEAIEWGHQLFDVKQVGFDPWNAGSLPGELAEIGLSEEQIVEVPQTFGHMSGPSKEFEADVLDGLVDAAGNALMTWCVANAVVQRDGKDNIQPIKKKSRGRIDPVVAAIIARKLAGMGEDTSGTSVYETRGIVSI